MASSIHIKKQEEESMVSLAKLVQSTMLNGEDASLSTRCYRVSFLRVVALAFSLPQEGIA